MTKLTRAEVAQWLQERDNFLILTHCRPDGDTAGSAAALCRGLRGVGKKAYVLENPELPGILTELHQGITTPCAEAEHTLIAVDVATAGMLPEAFAHLLPRIELRIDHHATSDSFTELELVDSGAGACGEIIYDILMELWADLDKETATALYVATSTDTGCFRFANTTDHTFLVAAACAAAGAPVFDLNKLHFETVSFGRLRMQAWMTENSRFFCDGAAVVCAVPRAVEQQLGANDDDMHNIASFLRTFAGVKVAALLQEREECGIQVSVRSVPGIDSGKICAAFGGGGHAGAGGTGIDLPLQEAADALRAEIEKVFV